MCHSETSGSFFPNSWPNTHDTLPQVIGIASTMVNEVFKHFELLAVLHFDILHRQKCNYEGMGLCPVKICAHHELVLTFHDRCVKCVCPTAALVAESRAFRLVKSRTTFKLAHTLMIWCKTET